MSKSVVAYELYVLLSLDYHVLTQQIFYIMNNRILYLISLILLVIIGCSKADETLTKNDPTDARRTITPNGPNIINPFATDCWDGAPFLVTCEYNPLNDSYNITLHPNPEGFLVPYLVIWDVGGTQFTGNTINVPSSYENPLGNIIVSVDACYQVNCNNPTELTFKANQNGFVGESTHNSVTCEKIKGGTVAALIP